MEFHDFPTISHTGKYAVVYDIARDNDGGLFYLSMVGSRQMTEGIAAALLDSGHRNKNVVQLHKPIVGENGRWKMTTTVKIATETIGAMRRVTRRVQNARVWQVVLYSKLMQWDYNYAHVQMKSAIESEDMSDHAKAQEELSLRRFVLYGHADEEEAATARRWFAYMPRRVSEPLLEEWAEPLWKYCLNARKGIKPLISLRGQAWLCEPASDSLREAVGYLGRAGELHVPGSYDAAELLMEAAD